jgi:hypothetical protein
LRNKAAFLFLIFVLSLATLPAHAVTQPTVGPNINIVTGVDRQRAEPTIAVDPRNPSILVAGAQDLDLQSNCCPVTGHRWNELYRSVDGGLTWTASLVPGFPGDTSKQGHKSPLRGFNLTSDPVVAFDRAGNVYYAGVADTIVNGTFVASTTGFVAKYINDGADYSGVVLISHGKDKPWVTVDNTGGPNDGNVYVIFGAGVFQKSFGGSIFVRSTDHGSTYSVPIVLGDNTEFASGITVDPSGAIYIAFLGGFGNIPVLKSTDGGLSFSGPISAASITPEFGPWTSNSFRTETLPQIAADNKGVYIVWDDNGTGVTNVLFTRSTDHGQTWSIPLTINNSTIGQHFFPTIAVSAGTISVAWYDSRLGQLPNGTITGLDVFYAESTDAGLSFPGNFRVTTVSFNPNLVPTVDFNRSGPFIGDYIQIASSAGVAHVIWTDNRNACDFVDPLVGCLDQDSYTAAIAF